MGCRHHFDGVRLACIYGLTDPRTDEIRYVGKSYASVQRRLNYHIRAAAAGDPTLKSIWIRELADEDLPPGLVILDESRVTCDTLNQREVYWIAKLRQQGARLTNATDGGDGGYGKPADIELYKERLSAAQRRRYARMTPAERVALSAAQGEGQRQRHAGSHN